MSDRGHTDEGKGSEVTDLLETLRAGDQRAADRLLPLVYDQLRGLARQMFDGGAAARHTLQPTALVHEAWMKMAGGVDRINDRRHFFALAARAMRQVLADHARGKRRAKRGGHAVTVMLQEHDGAAPGVDLVALDDSLDRLAQFNERHARIVEMRLLGGMTVDEVAGVLDVSTRTVESDWRMARLWLARELRG